MAQQIGGRWQWQTATPDVHSAEGNQAHRSGTSAREVERHRHQAISGWHVGYDRVIARAVH